MLSRRAVLAGAMSVALPERAFASSGPRLIAFVGFASPEGDRPTLAAFHAGLTALGYRDGPDFRIEAHSVSGDLQKGQALISALAARPVDVFLSPGPATTRAIVGRTGLPVVAIGLPPEPARDGLYASLARPGGSVTGFSTFGEDLSAKRIELLREVLPGAHTVGVLHNAIDPAFSRWGDQTIEDLTRQGLTPLRLPLSAPSPTDAARLVGEVKAASGQAIVVVRDFLTSTLIREICRLSTEAAIAVVGEHREVAEAGALFSYGPDVTDLFRRAAGYVDRIFRGEPAGTLPIQLPTKFELVLNTKTAQALRVEIPALMMIRADDVVE